MKMPTEAELIAQTGRIEKIMMALPEGLPNITRYVMASDIEASEHWLDACLEGKVTGPQAIWYSGSFARVGVATTLLREGKVELAWLLDNWPAIWRASDPDDTDPNLWDIWQQAFQRNGGRVLDNPDVDLPGRGGTITVYRGQGEGDPVGCAWTTDRQVAEAFARHRGMRAAFEGGVVLLRRVPRERVLAYVTERNEAEVILDPRKMGWTR